MTPTATRATSAPVASMRTAMADGCERFVKIIGGRMPKRHARGRREAVRRTD